MVPRPCRQSLRQRENETPSVHGVHVHDEPLDAPLRQVHLGCDWASSISVVTPCFRSASKPGRSALFWLAGPARSHWSNFASSSIGLSMQRPGAHDQPSAEGDDQARERQAEPPVVAEPIAAGSHHQKVVLMADRRQEVAGRSERHGHQEGVRGSRHRPCRNLRAKSADLEST